MKKRLDYTGPGVTGKISNFTWISTQVYDTLMREKKWAGEREKM